MTDIDFLPPPSPPPFLDEGQLQYLARHGHLGITLPLALQEKITSFFETIDAFFQLSSEQKSTLYPSTPKNLEENYHCVPDEKQFLSIRYGSAATGDQSVEEQVTSLWRDISHLLFRILFDIGHFLDIDNAAWYPMLQRCLHLPIDPKAGTSTLLRVFRYEPEKGTSEAHTDVGLLTLCVGRGKGLELWDRDTKTSPRHTEPAPSSNGTSNGTSSLSTTTQAEDSTDAAPATAATAVSPSGWHPAPEFTVLAGEVLRILTTNRIMTGLHRVVSNPRGRDSIIFALRPDLDSTIDLTMFGGWGEVPALTLWQMIKKGKYNVNDTPEVREAAKAKRRAEREKAREEGKGKEKMMEEEGRGKGKMVETGVDEGLNQQMSAVTMDAQL